MTLRIYHKDASCTIEVPELFRHAHWLQASSFSIRRCHFGPVVQPRLQPFDMLVDRVMIGHAVRNQNLDNFSACSRG
jgi:hypothetical protein